MLKFKIYETQNPTHQASKSIFENISTHIFKIHEIGDTRTWHVGLRENLIEQPNDPTYYNIKCNSHIEALDTKSAILLCYKGEKNNDTPNPTGTEMVIYLFRED